MRKRVSGQVIPASGPARESLREKGQFWTPEWIARAMVSYVIGSGEDHIFDPAVGAGAFFQASKALSRETGRPLSFSGNEIDPKALEDAELSGLTREDLEGVRLEDFILNPPTKRLKSIVANPPYIRHHRLSPALKNRLKRISLDVLHTTLDGRAGLHIYFLIRALITLAEGGRLAFIMPADTCEGVFASDLWKWIGRNYQLDAVICFAPEASPFPRVDTNPLIFLIQRGAPGQEFFWCRCLQPEVADLEAWVKSDFKAEPGNALTVHRREVREGIATGLSRPFSNRIADTGSVLGDFARTMRGIATGANDFFFLTRAKAENLGIPNEFLRPAIGRTRDAPEETVTPESLRRLELLGRPTLLFSPDGRALDQFPESVRRYLEYGESLGLAGRALIASRSPWYKMEVRQPPVFLFAYLGRRNTRFIRNLAGVLPLTGFLCVYPKCEDETFISKLWEVLRNPETIRNLTLVGKSYGSGAVKVEPRGLERLPIPRSVIETACIRPPQEKGQLTIFSSQGSEMVASPR